MMKLLLLSGGLDSACLFWHLMSNNETFRCMWIDYGQKNAEAELKSAQKLCNDAGVILSIIRVPELFKGVHSSILKTENVTHTVEKAELPNRNAVLINIAAAHCCCKTTILVAAHKTPAPYADCTSSFYAKMSKAISYSTNGKVDVEAPFIKLTKLQVLKKGWDAGMSKEDIENTVSCYNGNNCGECPPCKSRREIMKKLFY